MQRVYLLLRNNQQTGPYTFEELLQHQLKAFDLIWVEGKSYGWRYPTEVETLKPYVTLPDVPQKEIGTINELIKAPPAVSTPHKKVFVSLPENSHQQTQAKVSTIDPIEQKAEELRKRAQAFVPQQELIKTKYNRNLSDVEEDYTQWIYQKKTKKKLLVTKKQLAAVSLCALLVLSSLWAVNFSNNRSVVSNNVISPQNKTPEVVVTTDSENSENIPLPAKASSIAPEQKIKKEIKKTQAPEKTADQAQNITPEDITQEEEPTKQATDNIITETEKEVATEMPEKNKTFKEKIGELFKKRRPEEASVPGAENYNDERKATRRGEESETTTILTDVSNQVEIKTNKIADSWMMGVKNLKLTLYNRSDLTINAAKVEVIYYSDQNNLLDKTVITFTNVPAKKSQTIAVPDQRLADHIEYKILSATGIENAYAKQ